MRLRGVLLITGKLVSTHAKVGGRAGAPDRKGGEPLIRKGVDLAMRMLGQQFVAGETITEALERGREREARGYRYSPRHAGRSCPDRGEAARYYASYEGAIHAIGKVSGGRGVYIGPGIGQAFGIAPRYVRAQRERVMTSFCRG